MWYPLSKFGRPSSVSPHGIYQVGLDLPASCRYGNLSVSTQMARASFLLPCQRGSTVPCETSTPGKADEAKEAKEAKAQEAKEAEGEEAKEAEKGPHPRRRC